MMSVKREDFIQSAVKFLKDPKVTSSALAKKISFLESKGLSSEEIQEAISRTSSSTGEVSSVTIATKTNAPPPPPLPPKPSSLQIPYYEQEGPQPPPPVPYYGHIPQKQQQLGWKDYFIGTVVAIGASYGAFQLIKTYIHPLVSWPTSHSLENDCKKIDKQLSSACTALSLVKDETEQVVKLIESQAAKVNTSLDTLHTILKDLTDLDEQRDAEMRSMKSDFENLRILIPKMLDRSKEAQKNVLADLQTEIKSLKSLLINKRLGGAGGATSLSAIIPAFGMNINDENDSAASPASNITSAPQTTTALSVALPSSRSVPAKMSLPAWQLEAAPVSSEKKTNDDDSD